MKAPHYLRKGAEIGVIYSFKKICEPSVWQYNFISLRIYQQKAETHYFKLKKIKDPQYFSFSIDIKTTKTAPSLLRYSKVFSYTLTVLKLSPNIYNIYIICILYNM